MIFHENIIRKSIWSNESLNQYIAIELKQTFDIRIFFMITLKTISLLIWRMHLK